MFESYGRASALACLRSILQSGARGLFRNRQSDLVIFLHKSFTWIWFELKTQTVVWQVSFPRKQGLRWTLVYRSVLGGALRINSHEGHEGRRIGQRELGLQWSHNRSLSWPRARMMVQSGPYWSKRGWAFVFQWLLLGRQCNLGGPASLQTRASPRGSSAPIWHCHALSGWGMSAPVL